VEEAPGHGSDVVEETNSVLGSRCGDGTHADEETQVGVDLFRGAVGDSPVVEAVSSGTAGTFGEIRWNG